MALAHPPVLCVDDDPIVREMLCRQLTAAGYPTLQAQSVREAMDLLPIQRPRIIISDWAMPEADGMQLCRLLRARQDLPFTYVIMLTAHSEKSRLVEAFDAGVDDFLAKPFDASELEARLHAARRVLELEERLRQRMNTAQRLTQRLSVANARLKELASTDELTGLYNRRQAVGRLNELWKQAERYGQSLSVAIADVDRFKQINDQHGHAAGDAVLRQVAESLRQGMRECDIVCRIGGDEFLILMPNTSVAAAELVAERSRQAVRQREDAPIAVQVSIGTAERVAGMSDPQELLQVADRRLYAAKAMLPHRAA
jgi:diguanylate cyclase (GGDEF)-like protein